MTQEYKTISELVEDTFSRFTSEPAYTCAGHTLSFEELDVASQKFASYLRNVLNLQPGEKIALQMPNILQYPVAFYGAVRAGLVIVNANPLYTAREIKHQLVDSEAKVLVVLSNVASNAAEIIRDTQVEHVIVTNFADLHPTPKRQIINFVIKHVKKMVPPFSFDGAIAFTDIMKGEYGNFSKPEVTPESLLVLQYTGGTTGLSKGAMLSQSNLANNVWQLMNLLPDAFNEGKEVFIACLPLYHIYALNLHALSGFAAGEHNILIPNPRDLDAFIKQLKSVQATVFVGINTLYVALCRREEMKEIDFSKLKVSCAGGMALTEDAANAWKSLTGLEVLEGYGLTETSPVVAGNTLSLNVPGTIGQAVINTSVKVIDDEGNTLATDEIGELCVKGPQVMQGYWKKQEETAKVLDEEGWFKTGDMALIRDDGCIKIVDRKKDMILVSGFNVYPNEIEEVVSQHPKVLEVAAVGIKSEKTGEAVKLFVVMSDSSLTEEELRGYCRKNLTAYKNPKEIVFVDLLPKTNVGKILRRELREAS